MSSDLTLTFSVDRTPAEAFAAINDVCGWWSGGIEGDTDRLGAEFTYTVPEIHHSRHRITELVPGRRVAWLIVDSRLSFTADPAEWTGTTVVFDLAEQDGRTHVTFTHQGLTPDQECYGACSNAWGQYVTGSLRDHIESGAGRPNSFEGEEALDAVR